MAFHGSRDLIISYLHCTKGCLEILCITKFHGNGDLSISYLHCTKGYLEILCITKAYIIEYVEALELTDPGCICTLI